MGTPFSRPRVPGRARMLRLLMCLLSICYNSGAFAQSMDGGRYSINNHTIPPTLTLNSTWYRDFALNSSDSSSCTVTADTDVVVFTVLKPWSGGEPLAVALWQSWTAIFEWLGFRVASIGPRHLLDPQCGGRLRAFGVKVFVMPGGDTQLYAAFTEGRNHVEAFIRDGGLYVGSCGGFAYLTSLSYNMKNATEASFKFDTTMLDVFEAERGPVFGVGNMTPLVNQTPPVNGWPYTSNGAAVLAELSDGLVGGYAGGFPATILPSDADVVQRFSQVQDEPVAAVHIHGKGRNVLGFVYHPEFELGLPESAASSTGLFARQVLQPGDTHNLPMLQLRMWRSFGKKLLKAMETAKLPVGSHVKIPDYLRYRNPKTGVVWQMVKGEPAQVPIA